MLLVARYSISGGFRTGLAAALGICSGLFVHAIAAAIGLSALLAASSVAFSTVKFAGALYLIWLGFSALMAAQRGATGPVTGIESRQFSAFRTGLLTNVLNPKVAIVFLSLLPQFVDEAGSVAAQTMLLAAVYFALGLTWLFAYAAVLARTGRLLTTGRVQRLFDLATGTALVGFGLRLALSDQ